MKTDIEIAQEAKMRPITEIAAQLGLSDEHVIPYGRYKAKIDHRLIHDAKKQMRDSNLLDLCAFRLDDDMARAAFASGVPA